MENKDIRKLKINQDLRLLHVPGVTTKISQKGKQAEHALLGIPRYFNDNLSYIIN